MDWFHVMCTLPHTIIYGSFLDVLLHVSRKKGNDNMPPKAIKEIIVTWRKHISILEFCTYDLTIWRYVSVHFVSSAVPLAEGTSFGDGSGPIYRLVGGKKCSYTSPEIFLTWDSWDKVVKVSAADVASYPDGPAMSAKGKLERAIWDDCFGNVCSCIFGFVLCIGCIGLHGHCPDLQKWSGSLQTWPLCFESLLFGDAITISILDTGQDVLAPIFTKVPVAWW